MIPATRESVAEILLDLKQFCHEVALVGALSRGTANPDERADILCVTDSTKLMELGDYLNNALGQVSHGRVGPNDELSHKFPSTFLKIRGRMKLCVWCVSPREFGLMKFKLVGPAYFVQRAMAFWKTISEGGSDSGGLLIDKNGNAMDTDTEERVFEVLGAKFIKPENRK